VPEFILELRPVGDFDGDGLHDIGEFIAGTISDPANADTADTDKDGVTDGSEVLLGLDPLDGIGGSLGILGSVSTVGEALDVDALNDVVAVATAPQGITVFNVFNGLDPVIIAQVDTPGTPKAVAIDGMRIAVADGDVGLVVIDISDPPAADISARVPLGGSAQAVKAGGGVAYVGVDTGSVYRVDLRTGYVFDSLEFGASVQDIFLEGDHLYVLTIGSLHTVSVRQGDFSPVGSVATTPDVNTAVERMRLFVGGGIAYVVDRRGYHTIDVGDPASPVEIATEETPQFGWKQIVLDGSGRGVATVSPNLSFDGPHNIGIYDVTDPAQNNIFESEFVTPGVARAVALYNGIAYVADHTAGMQTLRFVPLEFGTSAPSITLEFGFETLEVEEGQVARVTALVEDDVQVRNVEFYMEGEKAATDGSFPFEHRFVAPRFSEQESFVIQARASDTAGNATFSQPFLISLLPDTTAPFGVGGSPRVGAREVDLVSAFFNEPLDPATVTSNSIKLFEAGADEELGTADDVQVTGGNVSLRNDDAAIDLAFDTLLPFGRYEAIVETTVTDRAGNALVEPFAFSFLVADVVFWAQPGGGDWNDPFNWSEGVLPGSEDDVLLTHIGGAVVFDSTTVTVRSILSSGDLTINGGRLDITETVQVNGTLLMLGGTLANATIVQGEGNSAEVLSRNGTLDSVHLLADMALVNDSARTTRLDVENGLRLDGQLVVPPLGIVTFRTGTHLVDGVGEMVLDGSVTFQGSVELTLGSGITVRGSGIISNPTSTQTVINQGRIVADVSGQDLRVVPDNFRNEGEASAINGGILHLNVLDSPHAGTLSTGTGSRIEILPDLMQDPSAEIVLAIGGTSTAQFGRINVQGQASLAGTLSLQLANGFEPVNGDAFQVITYQSLGAPFDAIQGLTLPNGLSFEPDYGPAGLTLNVIPSPGL